MKRLYFFSVILLLAATSLCAQTAKSVLDKTASVLSSYPSCSAAFTATMGQGTTSGNITLQGRKFYVSGNEALVWFDGQTQWMLLRSTNEVNVTTPSAQELQRMNPYTFLNLYKSGYDLSLKTVGSNHIVTLTAQKRQGIKTMEVTINKSSHLPSRVVMTTQKGSQSTISISHIKKGKKLPDSAFRFNQKDHPKATIVDLR